MFDDATLAFLQGAFQVAIDSKELEDGTFRSSFVAPNGTEVAAEGATRSDAHRQVTDKIREGVLNKTLNLLR